MHNDIQKTSNRRNIKIWVEINMKKKVSKIKQPEEIRHNFTEKEIEERMKKINKNSDLISRVGTIKILEHEKKNREKYGNNYRF